PVANRLACPPGPSHWARPAGKPCFQGWTAPMTATTGGGRAAAEPSPGAGGGGGGRAAAGAARGGGGRGRGGAGGRAGPRGGGGEERGRAAAEPSPGAGGEERGRAAAEPSPGAGVRTVRVRRVYDPPDPADGHRVLVDRLWPRGLAKSAAALDEWLRAVAPS